MGEMDGLSLAFAYPLLQWGCDGNSAVAERTMAVRRGDERISLQGCATGGVLGSKLRDDDQPGYNIETPPLTVGNPSHTLGAWRGR